MRANPAVDLAPFGRWTLAMTPRIAGHLYVECLLSEPANFRLGSIAAINIRFQHMQFDQAGSTSGCSHTSLRKPYFFFL